MGDFTLKIKQFLSNRLLGRRQFSVEVLHPGMANVSRAAISEKLAKFYNVKDPKTISVFGLRTAHGGGRSAGFGLIYDNVDVMQKYDAKHRLIKLGLKDKKNTSKKQRSELKNRRKKARATEKSKIGVGKK